MEKLHSCGIDILNNLKDIVTRSFKYAEKMNVSNFDWNYLNNYGLKRRADCPPITFDS